ncbi:outer membrane beta-barrel protein [uncultured Thalassolituus sp.]|uniref:outer membrane beta-barrel protein n=1 Tax=uncultured Thalassolituus sp. TaxID=285273 RepID=UPI002611D476|nr:outer membrane beta-barrel protein [uncultured Thalassolituus sp.]
MMKKTVLASAIALTLASSFTQAQEPEKKLYLGVNFGFGSGDETIEFDDEEYEDDLDVSTIRLSAGLILDERLRLEGSYNTYDFEFDGGGESDVNILEFDGILLFPSDEITPYITGGIGIATYEDTGEFIDDGDDLGGLSFQLGGGVIFSAADNFELDASYRMKAIVWETVEVFETDFETSNSLSVISIGGRVLF